ncbi:MAG: Smr/MutS family protein [Burkholderiales bacterium]|nr:Smr/MutS family protein [Burkholderiales bacterium]
MAKLSDLKGLFDAAQARARPAAPAPMKQTPAARRAIAAGKHADGDLDLGQAFADVQRLKPANRAAIPRARPAPVPHQTLADERDVMEASKYGDEPAPQTWDTGQEFEHEQTFVRPGLRGDLASKLRRGQWSVQSELDLHGMTADEAHDALSDFVVDARNRRLRCVRVIHGKGLTSPGKEPVLKGKVRRWLAHWDEVLAYTEAPRHAGGGGALLVLLKGS